MNNDNDLYIYIVAYAYDDFSDVGLHMMGVYLDQDRAAMAAIDHMSDDPDQAGRCVNFNADTEAYDSPIEEGETYVIKVKVDQRRAGDA